MYLGFRTLDTEVWVKNNNFLDLTLQVRRVISELTNESGNFLRECLHSNNQRRLVYRPFAVQTQRNNVPHC